MNIYQTLTANGVIAILRGIAPETARPLADAFGAAGIAGIEVTFNTSGAASIIEDLAAYAPKLCIGAGTVMTVDEVVRAKNAGARFILAPDFNADVVTAAKAHGLFSVPGAYTPSEAVAAVRAGADIVKIFPAGSAGPAYIKDLLGPLSGYRFMPVGGVSLANTADFIRAGAVAVGVGGSLVNNKLIAAKDWAGLEKLAAQFIAQVHEGRNS